MSNEFNMDEILAMAEQIERDGAIFYRAAAGQIADADAKKTLTWLADQEDRHEKIFAEMRAQTRGSEGAPIPWDPDGSYETYLQALAEGKIFDFQKDLAVVAEGLGTLRDIYEFALAREKDTIVFYMVVNGKTSNGVDKDRIRGILQEELFHVTMISDKLAAL